MDFEIKQHDMTARRANLNEGRQLRRAPLGLRWRLAKIAQCPLAKEVRMALALPRSSSIRRNWASSSQLFPMS
jgi:hypothetical protein